MGSFRSICFKPKCEELPLESTNEPPTQSDLGKEVEANNLTCYCHRYHQRAGKNHECYQVQKRKKCPQPSMPKQHLETKKKSLYSTRWTFRITQFVTFVEVVFWNLRRCLRSPSDAIRTFQLRVKMHCILHLISFVFSVSLFHITGCEQRQQLQQQFEKAQNIAWGRLQMLLGSNNAKSHMRQFSRNVYQLNF